MDANFAYVCLHDFKWTPSRYLAMDRREKAFVIACIQKKTEQEKKREQKMQQAGRRAKARRRR